MRNVSILRRTGRALADVRAPVSGRRRSNAGWALRLWSRVMYPFYTSIRVRFQFAFGLAVLGLVLMAVITILSSRAILDTYELSVNEAQLEMMPMHMLQMDLREMQHAAYRYAVDGELNARKEFKVLADRVDTRFSEIASNQSEVHPVENPHMSLTHPETTEAWEEIKTQLDVLSLHTPGTIQATNALKQLRTAIVPVGDVINMLHHVSMRNIELGLISAQAVGEKAFLLSLGAIAVGMGVLIAMGSMVGRSILVPIAELREAARKLAEKDFSHRVKLRNNIDELGQLGRAFNLASATLQRLYRELKRRSTHDSLTGVLNRSAFDERIHTEFKSADRHDRPLSLLMLDVDFFKRVNDSFGHQTGDHVLQSVAEVLEKNTRPSDVVTRYGGEEFAIILPDADAGSALAMAERLRAAIEGTRIDCGDDGMVNLTVSIGCTTQRSHELTPEGLVKEADTALYMAKAAGRNRVATTSMSPLSPDPMSKAA